MLSELKAKLSIMISVGEILRNERNKKAVKLNEVADHIRIREKFLQAIEENDWKFFTSKVYIEGVIKNYSEYLGLDSKRTIAFFRRDYEKKEVMRFKRKVSSAYLTPETRKVVLIVVILIFVSLFAYFGYQLKLYFSPPKIVIMQPANNNFKNTDKIKIIGKTEKDAAVTILGERVYQNKDDGVFEYEMALKEGKNELIIEAVGANGKKANLKIDFYESNR